jgi:alpha-D-xyloside xylohydrolase
MTGSFREIDGGVELVLGAETLRVQAWGRDAIRVQGAIDGAFAPVPDALVADRPGAAVVESGPNEARVMAGGLVAVLTAGGHLSFRRAGGRSPLLSEPVVDPLMGSQNELGRAYRRLDGGDYAVTVTFEAHHDERLYGLGQHANGRLDLKGCVIELEHRNAEIAIPALLSSRGYGMFWNLPSLGRVELAANHTRWVADRAAQIDYFVYAGDRPGDILASYYELTGQPRPLPAWTTGFWQSRTRYVSQDELMGVAREHWRRNLPLSVILVDYFHSEHFGDWTWRADDWPDPVGMIRELAEHGCRLMVSVWPHLNPRSPNAARFRDAGWLVRWRDGTPATFRFADLDAKDGTDLYLYDATNPDARAAIWSAVKASYIDLGARAIWVDACEPELTADALHRRYVEAQFHRGPGETVAGLFPLLATQAMRDGLDAQGDDDAVLMVRSGWAGSQRLGAIVWSGDTLSSWGSLHDQVKAGLGMMLSGVPWWNSDIGGFIGGDIADDDFRELLVRWFQYGAFCPVMRLHGLRGTTFSEDDFTASGDANEVWSFGERAYGILRGLLFFRERLRPYLDAQLAAAVSGPPPMRPLWFDDPSDEEAFAVEDQFLVGPDLVVAPVLEPGATSRRLYLPRGSRWRDPWTGAVHDGGAWITVDAPLEQVPFLVRVDGMIDIDRTWFDVPAGVG